MRVQPHLPSSPLLTTVISRSGLALCTCSAANSPAPPAPRIRMSVSRRSRVMRSSEHAHQQDQRDHRRYSGRDRRQDRKSTRLNSSHLGISYAVFCLKKKKTKQKNKNMRSASSMKDQQNTTPHIPLT